MVYIFYCIVKSRDINDSELPNLVYFLLVHVNASVLLMFFEWRSNNVLTFSSIANTKVTLLMDMNMKLIKHRTSRCVAYNVEKFEGFTKLFVLTKSLELKIRVNSPHSFVYEQCHYIMLSLV